MSIDLLKPSKKQGKLADAQTVPCFFDNADLWALRVTTIPANAVETILFSCWELADGSEKGF